MNIKESEISFLSGLTLLILDHGKTLPVKNSGKLAGVDQNGNTQNKNIQPLLLLGAVALGIGFYKAFK